MAYQPSAKHQEMMDRGREAAMLEQLGMVRLPDGRVMPREQLEAMRAQARAEAAEAKEKLGEMGQDAPLVRPAGLGGVQRLDIPRRPAVRPGDAMPIMPPRPGDPYSKEATMTDELTGLPVKPRKPRKTATDRAMEALALLLSMNEPPASPR